MRKYKVTVTETLERDIIIDARDMDNATEIFDAMYEREEIVLDSDDFNGKVVNIELLAGDSFVTKKEISELLKELDVATIRRRHEYGMGPNDGTIIRDSSTKKPIKGIYTSNMGPMHSATYENNEKVKTKIIHALTRLSSKITELTPGLIQFDFRISKNMVREVSFMLDSYPTYSAESDLDPEYKSFYWVLTILDVKQ